MAETRITPWRRAHYALHTALVDGCECRVEDRGSGGYEPTIRFGGVQATSPQAFDLLSEARRWCETLARDWADRARYRLALGAIVDRVAPMSTVLASDVLAIAESVVDADARGEARDLTTRAEHAEARVRELEAERDRFEAEARSLRSLLSDLLSETTERTPGQLEWDGSNEAVATLRAARRAAKGESAAGLWQQELDAIEGHSKRGRLR